MLQGESEMAGVQQDARQVRARRDPARTARLAAGRGLVRHRRERHHPRAPRRTTAPGTSSRSRSRAALVFPRTRCSGWSRTPRRTRTRRTSCASSPMPATRPRPRLRDGEVAQREPRQDRRGGRRDDRGPGHGADQALEGTDVAAINAKLQELQQAAQPLAQAIYADVQSAPTAGAGNGALRRPKGRDRRGRRLRGDRRRDGEEGVTDETNTRRSRPREAPRTRRGREDGCGGGEVDLSPG